MSYLRWGGLTGALLRWRELNQVIRFLRHFVNVPFNGFVAIGPGTLVQMEIGYGGPKLSWPLIKVERGPADRGWGWPAGRA